LLFLIAFGLVSLAILIYRVLTFNNCDEAAEELKNEIAEARKDLTSKGFKFN
jgi:dolichol-phosphate mannosyltransferase subunit 3